MQQSQASAAMRLYQIDPGTGWMRDARRIDSPNRDSRPPDCRLDLIVLHGISLPPGRYDGPWIEALFTNTLPAGAHAYFGGVCQLRVSAHLLIVRSGAVTQFVPFHMRAWHAGESRYRDRAACNDFSVGIELEGADDQPYADAQYQTLIAVIESLRAAYPSLAVAEIVGHCDIAPGRKTDPGPAFDWMRVRTGLRERQAGR